MVAHILGDLVHLKFLFLCTIMEVINNSNVYTRVNSHDPPSLEHKQTSACKVAAHLCALASAIGERSKWNILKRCRVEYSKESDSSTATCLHKRLAKRFFGESCQSKGRKLPRHPSGTRSWRFMYYQKGEWVEYPTEANGIVWQSLRAGHATAEFSVRGHWYRINFVQMHQVNLETGYMRSIGWIDEALRVFFPPSPCEGPSPQSSLEFPHPGAHEAWLKQRCASPHDNAAEDCFSDPSAVESLQGCETLSADAEELDGGTHLAATADSSIRNQVGRPDHGNFLERVPNSMPFAEGTIEAAREETASDHLDRAGGGPAKQETASLKGVHDYALLDDKLIRLQEGDEEFSNVKKKFLAGLGVFGSGTVIKGICRDSHSSPAGQARQQAFERQIEFTKQMRGDANLRYAWHGTSKTGVSRIILHGFGQPRAPKNGSAYGVGVYLAPDDHAHVSAVYSDNDENGEQHMVLCQVILGATELVKPGSDQFHPSSEHFDSGVDNLLAPKRLIVWSTHMNTHILPIYVISFTLPPLWHEMMAAFRGKQSRPPLRSSLFKCRGSKVGAPCTKAEAKKEVARMFDEVLVKSSPICNQTHVNAEAWHDEVGGCARQVQGPMSACLSFPSLFLILKSQLAPSHLLQLQEHYAAFKAGRLCRKKLIQMCRRVAGDARLVGAIRKLQLGQVKQEQEVIELEPPLSASSPTWSFAS